MNTRDYLTKIHAHLQDHNIYQPLIDNPTDAIAHGARFLIHYMHSQHVTDMATMKSLLPPRNIHTSLFYRLPEIHKNTTFFALLFPNVMVFHMMV